VIARHLISLSLCSVVYCFHANPSYAKDARSGQSGMASVYSYKAGRTASGERAQPGSLTAAHRSLPFGTMVQVTNRRNGRNVVVRINDRGPFIRGRIIDITPAAARSLGFSGTAPVSIAVVEATTNQ
jgi:peptidoglycan lytic transglycosylase